MVMISVSVLQQQYDNLRKQQQENIKRTGAVIYVWHFIVLRTCGTPELVTYFALARARWKCPP
jgi:hypothetical protein